jgi:hypothetical protein
MCRLDPIAHAFVRHCRKAEMAPFHHARACANLQVLLPCYGVCIIAIVCIVLYSGVRVSWGRIRRRGRV